MIDVSKAFRNYNVKTNTRSLAFQNIYINPNRLAKGNTKLVNILIFDLPAVKTCLNCSDCKDFCYAKKAEVQYTDTRIFRECNLELYNEDKILLNDLIVAQLMKTNKTTVRIHSSGDFFSQSYINFWNSIIKLFPEINFYAYTKVNKILDFSTIEKNKNFNLISSMIEDKVLNFGSEDYCNQLKKDYGCFICPATKKGKDIKCGKQCTYCISNKNVCFIQH